MEVDQNILQQVIQMLEMTLDPNSQEKVFEAFVSFSQNPQFILYLSIIISKQEIPEVIRTQACIQMRRYLQYSNPETLQIINNFLGPSIQYVFKIKPSILVRQAAALLSTLVYSYNIIIFPLIQNILSEIIQYPEIAENAFIFIEEFLIEAEAHKTSFSLNPDFINSFSKFVFAPYSTLVIKTAMHLSRIYSNSFRPTLIPLLITNFNALSEEATQYTIEIIGNSIFDDRNDIDLINFVISCISHPYEPTAISAARIFQNDQMIPLQEACILQLAQMTGRNFDLTQYNLSTQCLETLTDLLSIHPDEVMRVLYPRIQTALQSQDEQQTKCSLRCLSIIHTKIDKISELVDFVLPFLNSPLVCDAAYCLASIAETNPQFKKSVIDVLFMCIQNVQFPQKVRSQIQSFIPPLLCNILLPPDPYIKILLTLLMNTQEPYDQGLLLYLLSKFLENVTTLEDYDSVNALVQVAYLALKNFDVFGSAALHLFGNIIVKNRNVFQQVLIEVSEKAFQSLSDVENVNLVCYSIHFFMQAAVASVLYNLPIVEIIGKVSPCIVQLLRTESRLYAWDFLICLHDTYKDCFYALMDVFMRVIVETPNDERLEVIGRIAIITSYCIDDKGKEVINAFGNDIMRVLQEGFKFCVEDSNIERKRIGFCIAKVYLVAQAPVPQKIFEDLLLIFSDYMSEEEKKNFSPILHALYKQ